MRPAVSCRHSRRVMPATGRSSASRKSAATICLQSAAPLVANSARHVSSVPRMLNGSADEPPYQSGHAEGPRIATRQRAARLNTTC